MTIIKYIESSGSDSTYEPKLTEDLKEACKKMRRYLIQNQQFTQFMQRLMSQQPSSATTTTSRIQEIQPPISPVENIRFLVLFRPYTTPEKEKECSPDVWIDLDGTENGFGDRIRGIVREMDVRGNYDVRDFIFMKAGSKMVPIEAESVFTDVMNQ